MVRKASPSKSQISIGNLLKKYNLRGKDGVYIEIEDHGDGHFSGYLSEMKRQSFNCKK